MRGIASCISQMNASALVSGAALKSMFVRVYVTYDWDPANLKDHTEIIQNVSITPGHHAKPFHMKQI